MKHTRKLIQMDTGSGSIIDASDNTSPLAAVAYAKKARLEIVADEGAVLRPIDVDDVTPAYVDGMRDPDVTRFLYGVKKTPQSWDTVAEYVRANDQDAASVLFGIYTEGTLRGTVRLHNVDAVERTCHIGICIFDKRSWNSGLAGRSLAAAIGFAGGNAGLRQLVAGVDAENAAARHLFMRAGFRSDPAWRYILDGRSTDTWKWEPHQRGERTRVPFTYKPVIDDAARGRRTPGKRLRLLVVGEKDYHFRDFIQTGLLDELAKRFELVFLLGDEVGLDLSSYGPTRRAPRLSGLRMRFWLIGSSLQHIELMRRYDITLKHSVARATYGFSSRMAAFVNLAARLHLDGPIAHVARSALRWTRPSLRRETDGADVILASTSVKSALIDDLVRHARRANQPMLALQTNWDNIALKAFFELPPHIGVWGEQSFLVARLLHRIPANRIFVTGTPRFEMYRQSLPDRAAARRALGVPKSGRLLLFCGASVAFDETSLLEELDQIIEAGELGADIHVLYKPHFARARRAGERQFDPARVQHVTVFNAVQGVATDLEAYPTIFAAADAVISPFSTMVIEGARHGLPAICLGYEDPAHANHDWGRVAFNLHLYLIRHGDWAVVCEQRDRFLDCVRALMPLIGDSTIAASAKASSEMVFKHGRESVAARIIAAIETVSRGGYADNSALIAMRAS